MTPEVSVVVPFFNEESVAREVVDELCRELTSAGLSWEALLVDDGSADRTAAELERACSAWPQCRLLRLPRNLGQGPALFEGIRAARAPFIAMMDGDGQNVPADIPMLLSKLGGADMIVGIRTLRHDSRVRRVISRFANVTRGQLLGDGLSDAGCALKVFRREVAAVFLPLRMLNPFMPALAVANGFKVVEVSVQHRARLTGQSKYGFQAMVPRMLADFATVWRLTRRRKHAAR
jgi:dolichol-phosphate mannosyltransferase